MKSHLLASLVAIIVGWFLIGFGCTSATPSIDSPPVNGAEQNNAAVTTPTLGVTIHDRMVNVCKTTTSKSPMNFAVNENIRLDTSPHTSGVSRLIWQLGCAYEPNGFCKTQTVEPACLLAGPAGPSCSAKTVSFPSTGKYLIEIYDEERECKIYINITAPTLGMTINGETTNVCTTPESNTPIDLAANQSIRLDTLRYTSEVSQLVWQLGCKYEDEKGSPVATDCASSSVPIETPCASADPTCSAKTVSFPSTGKYLVSVWAANQQETSETCRVYFNVPSLLPPPPPPLAANFTLTSTEGTTGFRGNGTGDPAYSINLETLTFNVQHYMNNVVLTFTANPTGGREPYEFHWTSTAGAIPIATSQIFVIRSLPARTNSFSVTLVVKDRAGQEATVQKNITFAIPAPSSGTLNH